MITLIGKDLAKKGNEFIFYGSVDECENCRFKASCVDSLEKNRKYKIIDVRDNEQKCPVHAENTVIPVEVDRSNITLLSSSKSIFEGSTFSYESADCDAHDTGEPQDRPAELPRGRFRPRRGECKKGYKLNKLTLGFVI